MQRMAVSGNTYFVFDENGNGVSFTQMGRVVGEVKFANVSLSLRNIQDVQVLSILGTSASNQTDVYFDGMAGVSNVTYLELTKRARQLQNMCFVPLRISRFEEPGLMQVLYPIKPKTTTREAIAELFEVSDWRKL